MNKVIKVSDEEVLVGNDTGAVFKVKRSDVDWDVQLDDVVEVYTDGETTVIKLAKNTKVAKNPSNTLVKLNDLCKKKFPIIFCSIFAVMFLVLIVIAAIPHGKKYVYDKMGIEMAIEFSGDKVTISTNGSVIATSTYKIENGKLYSYNVDEQQYGYDGTISSTKIVLVGIGMELVEKTMSAIKTTCIVFMVISGLCAAASITVSQLNKKGIIKLDGNTTVVSQEVHDIPEETKTEE